MKKVLLIYYTQTGQLKRAVNATLSALENDPFVSIDYLQIIPRKPYPFPWSYEQFFDIFPETIIGMPVELEPTKIDADENYDLVVIAYQPWFLSICMPVNSFLLSREAKKILKNKPVITILACRNMWLNGQEKMKVHLNNLEADLVGNITFVDKAANLVSLVTVFAYMLAAKKERFLGIFPKYGVSDKDLEKDAPKFGEIILKHLLKGDYTNQQKELVEAGAVNIKSNLMLLEARGKKLFPLYARYIYKNGSPDKVKRRRRVRVFGIVLPTAILILSPVITVISRLAPLIFYKKINKEIEYYKQNTLR